MSNRFAERDERLLAHVARYQVWVSKFIEPLFFGSKTCGHIQKRLLESGALELHSRKIPGSLSYCTLSAASVSQLGLPKERNQVSAAALDQALAILYWCKMGKNKRIRLEKSEAGDLVGDQEVFPNNVVHCLSEANDFPPYPRLFRVYQSSTGFEKTVEHLKNQLEATCSNLSLKAMVSDRLYGLLVLVDSQSKAKLLSRRIANHPVSQMGLIHVDVGPTSGTLARALKEKWELMK